MSSLPVQGRNTKHVKVKCSPAFLFFCPYSLFIYLFFLPYCDVSGINHHSDDENQPSAAPQDTRGQRDSCCMVESYSCFQMVCHSSNPDSCGAAAPANKEFTGVNHYLEMTNYHSSSELLSPEISIQRSYLTVQLIKNKQTLE